LIILNLKKFNFCWWVSSPRHLFHFRSKSNVMLMMLKGLWNNQLRYILYTPGFVNLSCGPWKNY